VPLGIDIQALSDRIQADLRAGHDYYEHSKSTWRLVRRMARSGRAITFGNIHRELNALKYERPKAWFQYINSRVKLGFPTDEQIERFAEIKASRDILAQNRGVINSTYLAKAGNRSRYNLGQRLEIPESYLHDSW
jgi:hypothetical protein